MSLKKWSPILILGMFFLSSLTAFAQTRINAFGYKIEAPKDWTVDDQQEAFNFVEFSNPDLFGGKIVIKEKKGDSKVMMRAIVNEVRSVAFQLELDRTNLTADYIGDKLQTYATEDGLELLSFEHWVRDHEDGKQRYMLIFIARDGDRIVLFSAKEMAKKNDLPPANYKVVRAALESIKK